MIEIELPWPAKELQPNSRVHWAVKSRAAKLARQHAWLLTKQQLRASQVALIPESGDIHVHVEGYPKDMRRRDCDNLLSSSKAMLDGIADALGVDDRRFVPHPRVMAETRPGGLVRVRLEWSA